MYLFEWHEGWLSSSFCSCYLRCHSCMQQSLTASLQILECMLLPFRFVIADYHLISAIFPHQEGFRSNSDNLCLSLRCMGFLRLSLYCCCFESQCGRLICYGCISKIVFALSGSTKNPVHLSSHYWRSVPFVA